MIVGVGYELRILVNSDPVVGIPLVVLHGMDRKEKPFGNLLYANLPKYKLQHSHLSGGYFRVELRVAYDAFHRTLTSQGARNMLEVHSLARIDVWHVVNTTEVAPAKAPNNAVAIVNYVATESLVLLFELGERIWVELRQMVEHLANNRIALCELPLISAC